MVYQISYNFNQKLLPLLPAVVSFTPFLEKKFEDVEIFSVA